MILLVVPPGSKPVKYSLLHKTRHLLVNVFKTHTFNRLYLKTSNLIKRILIVIFSFLFTTCIEPIAPEFDFLKIYYLLKVWRLQLKERHMLKSE